MIRSRPVRNAGSALTATVVVLCGCGAAPGPRSLTIQAGDYAKAFDAAVEAAREAGLPAVYRDRRSGLVETAALPGGSILEPWTTDNPTLGAALESTIAYQRRRARFEFRPEGAPGAAPPPPAPDLLAVGPPPADLTQQGGPLVLEVRVVLERAYSAGIRRDTWSRALTTRARIIHAGERDDPDFWTPVARDGDFERRLLARVREKLERRMPREAPAAAAP